MNQATSASRSPGVFMQTEDRPTAGAGLATGEQVKVRVEGLSAFYGKVRAVRNVDLSVAAHKVTAIIGPSGCGKSTLLRCFNRMHEQSSGGRAEGRVLLDGENVYAPRVDPVMVCRNIGMVFQKASPFPTMSIFENVVAGVRLSSFRSKKADLIEKAERALVQAALWDEVKDKLFEAGTALSGGQQQRLCIARALAVNPEVLLMDEPCSALDPIATMAIEDLIRQLAKDITVVIVTHNMQQAARVSDYTAFMLMGDLVEYDQTAKMFSTPEDERTEAYITGRFG